MRVARPCRHGGPKGLAVGLDARTLASEVHSGVEEYVINLVSALSRLTEAPEIIAYVDRPIPDPEIAQAASSGPLRTSIVRARRGWLPPLLPCPAVVTVHDLAWVRYPETYEPKDLVMQRRAVAGAAARASHIIAVSDSTARDLRQHYPRSGDRVSVIPLGVSPQFSPDGLRLSSAAFPGAERLTRGYVLYAGGLQPRKNLLRLLVAYQKVLAETSAPPLVLAGAVSPHAHELRQAAQRLGIERHVVFPGYVAQDLLPALYRSATVFVYPSLYEGFGLPVLEAMACGVPVVTSNVSALPEVAGEAALLVDPESVERLSWAVSLLLADQALRQTLGQRGLARARQFTWEQTARQTVGVYQRFAAEE
jgi:glycosyltransferase involved in cell wall biosynthesis